MPADLSQIDIFQELPRNSLARLAMLSRERAFNTGSSIIRHGEVSDCLYIILSGKVRVECSPPGLTESVNLVEVGPGTIVGQKRFLNSEACSPTVTAVEEVEAIELSYTAVALTLLQYPETSAALLRTLTLNSRQCIADD